MFHVNNEGSDQTRRMHWGFLIMILILAFWAPTWKKGTHCKYVQQRCKCTVSTELLLLVHTVAQIQKKPRTESSRFLSKEWLFMLNNWNMLFTLLARNFSNHTDSLENFKLLKRNRYQELIGINQRLIFLYLHDSKLPQWGSCYE